MREGQEIIEYYTKEIKDIFAYTTPEILEWKIGVVLAKMANEIARDVRNRERDDKDTSSDRG